MPNNVKNVLTFKGSQFAIDELLKGIEGVEDGHHMKIDFNRIIPMPEDLLIDDGGNYEFAIQVFCANDTERMEIQNREKISDSSMKRYISLGEKYAKNKLKYGYCAWYYWRIHNWGTKWNAYEIEQIDNTIKFETAWATPIPVIRKLSEIFPTITIDHKFADEDIGNNCGHYVWIHGDIICKDELDDEEAEEFALDLWGWEKISGDEE